MVFDSKKIYNFVADDHFSLGGEIPFVCSGES